MEESKKTAIRINKTNNSLIKIDLEYLKLLKIPDKVHNINPIKTIWKPTLSFPIMIKHRAVLI